MLKIQPVVKEIVLKEPEAHYALTHGFMNMSGYAEKIRSRVEEKTKKAVKRTSLVIALSRIKSELKQATALAPKVVIANITTKLPLSEIVYENTSTLMKDFESLNKKVRIPREDFFAATVGSTEITIICSSHSAEKIIAHFSAKPKLVLHSLAAVAVSFDSRYFKIMNTVYSLISVLARARVNIAEIVSTYTELIFIVAEKDFSKAASLFSELSPRQE